MHFLIFEKFSLTLNLKSNPCISYHLGYLCCNFRTIEKSKIAPGNFFLQIDDSAKILVFNIVIFETVILTPMLSDRKLSLRYYRKIQMMKVFVNAQRLANFELLRFHNSIFQIPTAWGFNFHIKY